LFLPGEVMLKKLSFPPTVLMLSDENPGAHSLAKEIKEKYPDLTLTHDLGDGSGESNRLYLLYLNNQTWLGAAGIKLAEQAPRPRALPARRPPCTLCSVHSPVAATLRSYTTLPVHNRCATCAPWASLSSSRTRTTPSWAAASLGPSSERHHRPTPPSCHPTNAT